MVRIIVSLLFFISVALPARADRDASPPDALRAYQQGLRHYNLSQWQLALERFQAAYLAKPDPALLFNIGQCQRQLADYRGAANSFRAFLREQPNLPAAQRAQVESLLAQMEQAVRETRASQPPQEVVPPPMAGADTTTTTAAPAATLDATTAAPKHKPLHKRWWLWTVASVAVVGVGLGVGLGLGLRGPSYPAAPGAVSTVRF